jgi:pre-rRNA-processing protein IPI3
LSSQRGPITALVVGHGHGQANIAVSASEDQSIVVWDYKKGIALRTYLLRGIPRALVLDSSDRGFYTTYDDGSVQLVDFYADSLHINALYDEDVTTPVQPGDNHVWKAEGQELGDGLSLAISWDGTRLLSGHRSGKIASWDVRKGSFMAVVDTLSGPVSNLVMIPVQGLLNNGGEQTRLAEIVKPRLAPSEGDGATPGDYAFSAQLKTKLFASRFRAAGNAKAREQSSLQWALAHPSFSSDLLEGGITELASADLAPAKTAHGELRLDAGSVNDDEGGKVSAGLKAQNDHLTQQVAHLQKLQKASFAQIREKTRVIAALVKEQEQLAEIAKREYGWEIADANVEWNLYQQRQLKDHKQIESVNGNGSITARSDEVTAEGEDEHMSDGTNGKLDRG